MKSLRPWLGSGAVVAGMGAAMLCGAGLAAADTGADPGPVKPSTQATSASPGVERGARKNPGADVRPAASTGARGRSARVAPVAAAVSRAAAPSTSLSGGLLGLFQVPKPAVPTPVKPSDMPVDPAQFAGTYYEQGSVKQFFSIGLVNIKAIYTLKPDGTLRVQNSGNYFFKRGPLSSIVGSAVPVNADNTALSVGFGPFNSAKPPGNYTILARATDYSWVIVSDPSGRSGYILTRNQTIDAQMYQQLVAEAQSLGVRGRITPTRQFPS